MRLFADGVVALCIRTLQGDGSTLDRWYGLFLLTTELDDERLMRLRLERLLCWRESPERWSSYQHMLPVLILATSPRQREHWQHAVEAAALKLRLEPLAGALACLLPPERAHVNPWLLTWRTLSTAVSCHLQEVLRPRRARRSRLGCGWRKARRRRATHDHNRMRPLPQYPPGHPLVSVVSWEETWPSAPHTSRRMSWRNRR
jgi:hypothetical protein